MLALLNWTENCLADNDIQNPKAEAEFLLAGFLGCSKVDLYLRTASLDRDKEKGFLRLVGQRRRKVPLQILLGNTQFMDWTFLVQKGIFIPRPETEVLVEETCRIIGQFAPYPGLKILDLGTGSGIIAISLAKKFPSLKVYAADKSSRALSLAKKNAVLLEVENRIFFRRGDLFSALKKEDNKGKFSLIVSNPPYIPRKSLFSLPDEVKNFDPVQSLDGGKDGLEFYRRLFSDIRVYLQKGGFLILEIGDGQEDKIKALTGIDNRLEFIRTLKDYYGKKRVMVIRSG